MISHIVLLRLEDGLSRQQTEDFLTVARNLLGAIPGVRNLRVGSTLRDDGSHPLALVMDFENSEALEAYQVHPEHQRFLREVIGPIVADKQVLDFECP